MRPDRRPVKYSPGHRSKHDGHLCPWEHRTLTDHQESLKKLIAPKGWISAPRGGGEIPYYGEEYVHKYVTVWTGDIDT